MTAINMYVVNDIQAKASMTPIYRESDETAIRDFTSSMVASDSPMSAHPEDYSLWYVGIYNDETMEVIPAEPRKVITGLVAVKESRILSRENQVLNAKIDNLQKVIEDAVQRYKATDTEINYLKDTIKDVRRLYINDGEVNAQ